MHDFICLTRVGLYIIQGGRSSGLYVCVGEYGGFTGNHSYFNYYATQTCFIHETCFYRFRCRDRTRSLFTSDLWRRLYCFTKYDGLVWNCWKWIHSFINDDRRPARHGVDYPIDYSFREITRLREDVGMDYWDSRIAGDACCSCRNW